MPVLTAANVYRDYETAGVPSSGPHAPRKTEIRQLLQQFESALSAFTANGGLVYATKAQLDADLAHAANSSAWVVSDATAANNGIYRKAGGSGSGSWSRVFDLPYSFIPLSDAGAGAANAIVAGSDIPLPGPYGAILILGVFEANTGAATLAVNGGAAKPLVSLTGAPLSAGALRPDMALLLVDDGTSYRLLTDADSAANVELARLWANAPEEEEVDPTNHPGEYSARHWRDQVLFEKTYAREWSQSAALISAAAGGDGVSDRSAKWHAERAEELAMLTGDAPVYPSVIGASSATIPAARKYIYAAGLGSYSDGQGGVYERVPAEPVAEGFRSQDRFLPDGSTDNSDGGWWQRVEIDKRRLRAELGLLPATGLRKTWEPYQSVAQGGVGILRVVVHGDSVAQNIWSYLAPMLHDSLGGYPLTTDINDGIGDASGTLTGTLANPLTFTSGFTLEENYTYWPGGRQYRATDQTITFSAGFQSTDIKLYYVKEIGAGTFDVKLDGVSAETGDADNATTELGIVDITQSFPAANQTLTIEVTGTVRFIMAYYADTRKSGCFFMTVGSSGYRLDQQLGNDTAKLLYEQFLADFDPHLFSFDMKDPEIVSPANTFTSVFGDFCDILDAAIPHADKLMISANPYWGVSASNEPALRLQHRIMREAVLARDDRYIWVDDHATYGDDADDLGFDGDTIHPSMRGAMHGGFQALQALGIGRHPWGFNPLPSFAVRAASRFGWGTAIGPGSAFTTFLQELVIESINSGIDIGMKIPRMFAIRDQAGNQLFRISTLPTTNAYETAFPANGYLLLDGPSGRTLLRSNQTMAGIKGVDLWDKTDAKQAPLRALFVAPSMTVAQAPAPSTVNGMIVYLTDGSGGAGLYTSVAGNWVKLS